MTNTIELNEMNLKAVNGGGWFENDDPDPKKPHIHRGCEGEIKLIHSSYHQWICTKCYELHTELRYFDYYVLGIYRK